MIVALLGTNALELRVGIDHGIDWPAGLAAGHADRGDLMVRKYLIICALSYKPHTNLHTNKSRGA
jgi:hypothetical protein